jgi:nickel-dependent lactate racemase
MITSQATARGGKLLTEQEIINALHQGFAGLFTRQKVLVLIPDHTRSLPLPFLFRSLVEILHDTRQLDFMVALGTHPSLSPDGLNHLVGTTVTERAAISVHGTPRSRPRQVNLLNHAWNDPSALTSLGVLEADEIKVLAGERWHPTLPERVDILINRAVLAYDHIIILGPTFPHEVVGFSGGAKYLFPGISGPDMINATHWLGALAGVVGTIGLKETPVRAMIHAAARRLTTPVTLAALVLDGHQPAGIFIGDLFETWSAAADLSAQTNVIWCDQPYRRVLSCALPMYDELWTAAKAMYKLEPAVEVGGEVVIYAPHLDVVSRVHGEYIYEIGYHILPYFLNDWQRFKHVPLGVLAHSTHVRGSGVMEQGALGTTFEKTNVTVTLASQISAEDCARLNLRYLDPAAVNVDEWKDQESTGNLYVPRAGEMLYRVR